MTLEAPELVKELRAHAAYLNAFGPVSEGTLMEHAADQIDSQLHLNRILMNVIRVLSGDHYQQVVDGIRQGIFEAFQGSRP